MQSDGLLFVGLLPRSILPHSAVMDHEALLRTVDALVSLRLLIWVSGGDSLRLFPCIRARREGLVHDLVKVARQAATDASISIADPSCAHITSPHLCLFLDSPLHPIVAQTTWLLGNHGSL